MSTSTQITITIGSTIINATAHVGVSFADSVNGINPQTSLVLSGQNGGQTFIPIDVNSGIAVAHFINNQME